MVTTRSSARIQLYCLISILVIPWSVYMLSFRSQRIWTLVGKGAREVQEGAQGDVQRERLSSSTSDSFCSSSLCPLTNMTSSAVVIWLHGLGDTGAANVGLKSFFTAPYMKNAKWLFPSAPVQRVTANYPRNQREDGKWTPLYLFPKYYFVMVCAGFVIDGAYMPSWFDVGELPISAQSPEMEAGVMKAVQSVHSMIDKEVTAGVSPDKIFLCGFSQGGALSLASALLYPETLGGAGVFSGWVALNPEFISKIPAKAKQTPVLWSHGMSDNVVDFKCGQAGPPLLEHAGVGCEFKAYPGLGHSIDAEELSYLQDWFGRRLGGTSSDT